MTQTKLSPVVSAASIYRQTPHVTPLPSSQQQQPLGHGKAWTSFQEMGLPVNKFVNMLGSEAFWPTGLEEESDKAARILRSFCRMDPPHNLSDGGLISVTEQGVQHQNTNSEAPLPQSFPKSNDDHDVPVDSNVTSEKTPLIRSTSQEERPPLPPRGPRKISPALLKIPAEVIHNALGLAIFTTFRAGTWGASLAAGSGVFIARDINTRQWSSPSAIGISTLGLGLVTGIDVADCVIVINTTEALEKFKSMRISLGAEVALTAGPWGAGKAIEYTLGTHTHSSGRIARKPTYTYIKSRGIYAGLQLDGTVIGVRSDENAKFYGESVEVQDILSGQAQRWTELQSVLGEVDATRGLPSQVQAANSQIVREPTPPTSYAPVLLEFVDRRGQHKGSDGVWYKDGEVSEVGKEPSLRSVTGVHGYEADKKQFDYDNVDRYA